MSSLIYRLNSFLSHAVAGVPVGTNLGLFHLLWILLSVRLLHSCGALIPGLAAFGLSTAAVLRAWAALAYGAGARRGCWPLAAERSRRRPVAEPMAPRLAPGRL